MDWTRTVNAYCERTDAAYWSEPVNAVTNAAFLIAAFVMWRRVRGQGLPLAMTLVVILALIGVGSFLFHTHATVWSSLADVVPIGVFILVYILVANLHVLRLPVWGALLATVAAVPAMALLATLIRELPFFRISAPYWPVALLIAAYALALRRRAPRTARGLALGAAILFVSLVFRSLDAAACGAVPVGTHFMWHLLNGLMLGWMIEVYRRHMLAERGAGR
jgi:hypothetical protein